MLEYGTTAIPSDHYSVVEGGTVQIGAAFERSVGLIGGMDTATGTATEGEVVQVSSSPDAQSLFGDGSELHEQCKLAFQNGAVTVYALPVSETQTTESFSTVSSGTLSNVPFFNPHLHDEHSITAQDTSNAVSVDVNIVYVDGSPSAPTSSNTINLDYLTGQWTADASSSYEITYTYGDYSATVVQKLAKKGPRIIATLTEDESTVTTVGTELDDKADNFVFMHQVAGAHPFADPTAPNTSGYSDGVDDERTSLVAPPYGYVDAAETNMQRVHGAVAGHLASLPLGLSATNNELSATLTGLRTDLLPSGAGDLIDAQVMPLIDYPPVTVVKDMTTSTTQKFERVYAMEVIDEATEISHQINRQFLGEQNTQANRKQLERSHKNSYGGLANATPPLLDDYAVDASKNNTNNDQVDVTIGLDVVDVMDTIEVTITVGDVVRAAGVR